MVWLGVYVRVTVCVCGGGSGARYKGLRKTSRQFKIFSECLNDIFKANPTLKFSEINNTDKEDEEGGKPTQRNGAVHAAGVTGERSEERRSAGKVTLALLSRSTSRRRFFCKSIPRK